MCLGREVAAPGGSEARGVSGADGEDASAPTFSPFPTRGRSAWRLRGGRWSGSYRAEGCHRRPTFMGHAGTELRECTVAYKASTKSQSVKSLDRIICVVCLLCLIRHASRLSATRLQFQEFRGAHTSRSPS